MSLPYLTSEDAPTQLAIMPDWGEGVRHVTVYRTAITRSRRGLEQRAQQRRRPSLAMDYKADASNQAALRRLEETIQTGRTPLLVPWWCSGCQIASMATADAATLGSAPIAHDWNQSEWVYFWHRTAGSQWRQIDTRDDREITFVPLDDSTTFPAGAFIFPARLAVREKGDDLLTYDDQKSVQDRLVFRTL